MLSRCRARYGDVFTIRLVYEGNWVVIADPDLVREVFQADSTEFLAGEANRVLGPVLGPHSIVLLDGEEHLRARRLLLAPFSRGIERYAPMMREIAEDAIAGWPVGRCISLLPRMHAITLRVMMRCVLGDLPDSRLEELRRPLGALLEWSTKPTAIVSLFAMGPGLTQRLTPLHRLLGRVDRVLLEEIRRRRDDPHVGDRDDVLSMLVLARDRDGPGLADREIRDQLVTLLIAGHETTAGALAWALERLLRAPQALAAATLAAERNDTDYLGAACKEALRLRPVLPLVGRRLATPARVGGWSLPAGTTVAPCIYLLHRREDLFPEPGCFSAERFLQAPSDTSGWIPFGGGTHRCLGAGFALLEMREVLRAILTGVSLRAARPEAERMSRRALTWTPRRGAEVVVLEQRLAGHDVARASRPPLDSAVNSIPGGLCPDRGAPGASSRKDRANEQRAVGAGPG